MPSGFDGNGNIQGISGLYTFEFSVQIWPKINGATREKVCFCLNSEEMFESQIFQYSKIQIDHIIKDKFHKNLINFICCFL